MRWCVRFNLSPREGVEVGVVVYAESAAAAISKAAHTFMNNQEVRSFTAVPLPYNDLDKPEVG